MAVVYGIWFNYKIFLMKINVIYIIKIYVIILLIIWHWYFILKSFWLLNFFIQSCMMHQWLVPYNNIHRTWTLVVWGCEGTNTNISIWSIGTVKMKECHINFTIIKFDTIRDSFTSSSKQNNIATSHGSK